MLFHHPKQVCMTYITHFKVATRFSSMLFVGGLKSFVHAVYPDVYVTSTSELITDLQNLVETSGCHEEKNNKINISMNNNMNNNRTISMNNKHEQ